MPAKKPAIVDVPPGKYLVMKGEGPPGGEAFQQAVGALYSVAFTVKMSSKKAGRDYKVSQLEGFYDKVEEWKLAIPVPDFIGRREIAAAKKALKEKGKPAEVQRVDLETIREGKCVEMLHVGPYDQEAATIAVMREAALAAGFDLSGPHHEIYLSDPRRVPPERLRTVLRYPLTKRLPSM